MSTPTEKEAQEKANLARIRDNQRRSRARRKEYLQDLEQRLRVYELQGVEASAEIQQAARRVLDENKKLRTLLNEQGITDNQIDSFLQASNNATGSTTQGSTAAEESVIQALSRLLAPVSTPIASPGYDDDSRRNRNPLNSLNVESPVSRPLLNPTGGVRHSTPSHAYEAMGLDEDAQAYHNTLSSRNSLDLDRMALNMPTQRPNSHLSRQSISDQTGMWSDAPPQISPVSTVSMQTSLISHGRSFLDNVQYAQQHTPAFSSQWHSSLASVSTTGSGSILSNTILPIMSNDSPPTNSFGERMDEDNFRGSDVIYHNTSGHFPGSRLE